MMNKSVDSLHKCTLNHKVMHGETYANVEKMLATAKKIESMLGELGETPFEPFKQK